MKRPPFPWYSRNSFSLLATVMTTSRLRRFSCCTNRPEEHMCCPQQLSKNQVFRPVGSALATAAYVGLT
ncbi:hypothetical protein CLOP_g18425 [Closterium sp. NIES-67]|nr:hypothetical protein CLOP_g18425 [Closterium sp. NIES-67]